MSAAKVEATAVYRVQNEADPMPVAHSTDNHGSSPIVVSSVAMNDNRIVVGTDSASLSPNDVKEPRGEEWKGLNPAGLTANVSDLCITPNEILAKNLLEGEEVLREFDCYFPGHFLPRWYLWTMIFVTCGFYLIVLAYRACMRWVYRQRCLTPSVVRFRRGKMAVTNMGRIICYYIDATQKKLERGCCCTCIFQCCCRETCGAPVKYKGTLVTRVYATKNIRQISQHYASKALCCGCLAEEGCGGCCCIDYNCGLVVSFNQFDHADQDYNGQYNITTKKAPFYVKLVSSIVGAFQIGRKLGTHGSSGSSQSAGIDSNGLASGHAFDHKLYVLSNTYDLMHDGDVHNVVDHLCDLHKKLVEVLPESPDILCRNGDLEVGSVRSKLSFTERFVGTKVVYDDTGEINIPAKWLTLQPNEEVLTTTGQVYKMTFWDWVLSILTVGYWYCIRVRKKKFSRSAIVVTNKRIIEMVLYQRAGEVPSNLANVDVRMTSYYPNKIKSGIFISSGAIQRGCVFKRVQNLECVLETEGGMISFDFYNGVDGLYFAKAVTMVPAREALIKKPLKFPANFVGEDVGALAQELLPLFPDETVRCNFRGKSGLSKFAGFCVVGEHNVFIEALNAVRNLQGEDPIYYWCSKEILGCCWPWLPYFLTCCLRPFIYQEQLLITDTAVLTLRTTRNYGLCGFRPLDKMESTLCGPQEMCFAKQGDFELAWSPLSNMNGHNFGIAFGGSETCITRCCKGNICGRICCPISRSSYDIGVNVGSFNYVVSGKAKNHNYYKDDDMAELLNFLSQVEVAVHSVAPTAVAQAEPVGAVPMSFGTQPVELTKGMAR